MHRRVIALPALLLAVLFVVLPVSTNATLLWGHPYVMLYDRDNASLNYKTGVVFMWNDLNIGTPYVGSATIRDLATGGFFAKETWESLFQGMLNKKLTYIWTDAGPDTNVNDGSTGDLEAFAVTIFGN
jgi:hypothetical protein